MLFFFLSSFFLGSYAINNSVGITPAMGWNTWNHFACDINEQLIRDTADALLNAGYLALGYKYINLDDCWQGYRDDKGIIHEDPYKFPSGMKSLVDYVHSKGFLFGIYSDAGPLTCAGYPGSRGYEVNDAQTYVSWGVDYLKYDNCFANASDWVVTRYQAMSQALLDYAPYYRPILYATCDWGVQDPWRWAPDFANSWRTSDDIKDNWESMLSNLDNSVYLGKFAGPGQFNDPDMLEVGNGGMTQTEYQAHFALWCLMKSPLILGCDITVPGQGCLSAESEAILMNKELIAVNQDPLGVPGDLIWKEGPNEIWAGPLHDGSRIVIFLNRHTISTYVWQNITVNFTMIGYLDNTKATVRDLYRGVDLGDFTGSFSGMCPLHGCPALRITPQDYKTNTNYNNWRPWDEQCVGSSDDDSSKRWIWELVVIIVVFLAACVCCFFLGRHLQTRKRQEDYHHIGDQETGRH